MKHVLVALSIVLLLVALVPPNVYAHFSKTDGDMSVTLHVDPDDDPIPNQQAFLYFLFDDKTNRFKLSNCTCSVIISQQGRQIFHKILTEKKDAHPSIWGAGMPYVFPQRDVYQIKLTGKPKSANAFGPFDIFWDFRVDPEGTPGIVNESPSDIQILLGATLIAIVFVAINVLFFKKQLLDSEAVDTKKKTR